MLMAIGWCVLRVSLRAYQNAKLEEIDALDEAIEKADLRLWTSFREWMTKNNTSPLLL